MALTVNEAFDKFNKNIVNLDDEKTKRARASRDWLIAQLEALPQKNHLFPDLFDDMHVKFGSFSRNTKIRPLDDIDLILTFHAKGSNYFRNFSENKYLIKSPRNATILYDLCDENGYLNSIRLVNRIVRSLNEIEHYKKSECHRQQEAATLNLNSYDWSFDIVPAFYTDTGHFLIPDGNGAWKGTDPRIDQSRITDVNQKHDGKIIQCIRTLKYWNKRPSMPTIPPYLFENIILNYFHSVDKIEDWIDCNLMHFWNHLKTAIFSDAPDPKGFQGNLNTLPIEIKNKIYNKADEAYRKASEAIKIEVEERDHAKSINKWREIFGDRFPTNQNL